MQLARLEIYVSAAILLLFATGPTGGCGDDVSPAEVCGDWECGEVEGVSCGTCQGATQVCRFGHCVDPCQGRDCGEVEGVSCGTCQGATEVCLDSGRCVDVCADRECGRIGEVDCGFCQEGSVCSSSGHCVSGDCPPDMVAVWDQGFCIDAHLMTKQQAVRLLNDHGTEDCGEGNYPEKPHIECSVNDPNIFENGPLLLVQPGYEDSALSLLGWYTAAALCRWQGKRLCHMSEMQVACEGPEGHVYPYGDEYEQCRCHYASPVVCPEGDGSVYDDTSCEGGYDGLWSMVTAGGQYTDECQIVGDQRRCQAFGQDAWEAVGPDEDWSVFTCQMPPGERAAFVRCCKDLEPLQ